MRTPRGAAGAILVVVALGGGCKSRPRGGDAGPGCHDSSKIGDLASPAVGFRADVVPILEQSCAFVSCHGTPTAAHGVAIGRGAPDGIHEALVGKVSAKYMGQTLVVPRDASRSFLLKKLDENFCALDCGKGGCGDRMPRKNPLLPQAQRSTIARWIEQGAKND